MLTLLICAVLITVQEQSGYNLAAHRHYQELYVTVGKIVEASGQVAKAGIEKSDIRALRFYLTKLRRAIDAGDWQRAEAIKRTVQSLPAFQRSHVVAVDAKRRLAERKRADEERRHKEEMQQAERLHEIEMRRRQNEEILRALEILRYN